MISSRFFLALVVYALPAIAAVTDFIGSARQALIPAPAECQAADTMTNPKDYAVTPEDIVRANRDGFFFENPETDCKYVSQPYIYKAFKTLETDLSRLFTLINKDVYFTVVGNHPIAGIYHDLMHFYVNALRRVAVAGSEHLDAFRVKPVGIHGGCNEEWSVQEMNFRGLTNSGMHENGCPLHYSTFSAELSYKVQSTLMKLLCRLGLPFDIINVWVTRWSQHEQMIEVRTYVDSTKVTQILHENEIWWNATRFTDHTEFEPGPAGMPNLTELEQLMPEGDRPKH